MFKIFIIIISIVSYSVTSDSICDDVCVCSENKDAPDFLGEYVDCSFHKGGANILKTEYLLPNPVFMLNLSSNNITSLEPSKLLKSTSLAELFLHRNAIKQIKSKELLLPELKRLDISDNQIEYIDKEAFRDINKLEYLNLANNKLTTYESIKFHRLRDLDELILDNNDLGSSLEETNLFDRNGFGLTHKIKILSISGVNLNVIPENFFADAYDIRILVISRNHLTDVSELPFTLEYLDLSDNPITEISEEDFSDLPGLQVLMLNNLLIKEVSEFVFTPLRSLVHLELERNKFLTVFSSLAFGQEVLDDADDFALENLSLKGSRLSKLDKNLAEPFSRLILLDLQGNPWKCDCGITWLKSLQIKPELYEHLRCDWPKPLYNGKIFELDNKYFSCTLNRRHVGFAIAVTAFCVVLAAIAIWLFVYVPRYSTKFTYIKNMTSSVAAYSLLPVGGGHPSDL